jgi:hypothetical protein
MMRYISESEHPFIRSYKAELESRGMPFNDDLIFGLYTARKLLFREASPEVLDAMKTSFAAHKAWISAGQTLSYCGRVRDPQYAAEYLKVAIKYLEDKRFSGFRKAYLEAFSQSRHSPVLEAISAQEDFLLGKSQLRQLSQCDAAPQAPA